MASASEDQVREYVERSTNTDDITDAFVWRFSSNVSSSGGASSNYTAIMSTERHAREYNMRHKNRGLALIFNHEHFMDSNLDSRTGTNVDSDNLKRCLEHLGFDVKIHKDYTYGEIKHKINWAAQQDHTNSDCILVVILSHGKNGLIYAKDMEYKFDNIWNYFTAEHCPSLAGKPKLFFIQACQGDRLDPGVTMRRAVTQTEGDSSMSYKIPVHADFLIAYSTIPGFSAFRDTKSGSWFIQSLCKELEINGKRDDILTLLTFVCQRVAVDFESFNSEMPKIHKKKQIPCITSMLTRLLHFHDKNSIDPAGRA